MTRQRVLIVGSGPAAAYAVLAARAADANVRIMSNAAPNTDQAGAFFLHWLPEQLGATPEPVEISSTGTRFGYLTKQWGNAYSDIPTSFPTERRTEMWYNSNALKQVWATEHVQVCGQMPDHKLATYGDAFDWVFHTFPSTWSGRTRSVVKFPVLSTPSLGLAGTLKVVYNGDMHWAHTRTTVAWGRTSVEFPRDVSEEVLAGTEAVFVGPVKRAMLRDIHPATLPVEQDEWLAPNVVPVGRFAQWDRHALSHHAYERVYNLLAKGAL